MSGVGILFSVLLSGCIYSLVYVWFGQYRYFGSRSWKKTLPNAVRGMTEQSPLQATQKLLLSSGLKKESITTRSYTTDKAGGICPRSYEEKFDKCRQLQIFKSESTELHCELYNLT